ncbi:MAG: hypothetical protein WCX81_04485 [Monoglobales bacterium]
MNTPIFDFVKKYSASDISRLHMPGHKGKNFFGLEKFDITEVSGADVLSSAEGIIAESEKNASALFGSGRTFYSTEGSAAAICGMLALVGRGKTTILAARNVHKAFVHACALLDYNVDWIIPDDYTNLLKCEITAQNLEKKLLSSDKKPNAVYLTSPDYLGNIQNISEIAEVCRQYNIPLLIDNAHGAYLGFLEKSLHPIHLGATVCCDSAHKTLHVLTGGAYLHIAKDAPKEFAENAREKLSLFTSTSPSYLILQSLDLCNRYLFDGFREKLSVCIEKTDSLKDFISSCGFAVLKTEPLKITIESSRSGYSGNELAEILRENKIEPEFCDNDFVVLMFTPQNSDLDFIRVQAALKSIFPRRPKSQASVKIPSPQTKMPIREAVFAPSETVDVSTSIGRICAAPTVSCPPAVPIAVSGEIITDKTAELFKFYGIEKIKVVKK